MTHLIALVEDSPAEAEVIQEYCKRYSAENSVNIDVKWFPKGETFLRDYQPVYDLVLMDINMPVMDGYDALRLIRERAPDIPVIALTAYAFETDRQRMFQAGFNECLAKPLRADELRSRIASLLSR